MENNYFHNYLSAIDNPLPELKLTFQSEYKFFKRSLNPHFNLLEIGCGAGRLLKMLAPLCERAVGVDTEAIMLDEAKKRCSAENIHLLRMDGLNLGFHDNLFDLTYSTYNLIGSLDQKNRQQLISEMARVTKKGGKVVNFTWRSNDATTNFLKEYYPSIGIRIIEINQAKTVTSKGTFERISKGELLHYYQFANLKEIEFLNIGPLWLVVIGHK